MVIVTVSILESCVAAHLAWLLWYRQKTVKLTQKHQVVWDRIKACTPKECQFDAWCDYTELLWHGKGTPPDIKNAVYGLRAVGGHTSGGKYRGA